MHEKDATEIGIQLQQHNCTDNTNNNITTNHTIQRITDRERGSDRSKGWGASAFYIDKEHCKIDAVRALVSNMYSISIDN
jgi:hypothetical protein